MITSYDDVLVDDLITHITMRNKELPTPYDLYKLEIKDDIIKTVVNDYLITGHLKYLREFTGEYHKTIPEGTAELLEEQMNSFYYRHVKGIIDNYEYEQKMNTKANECLLKKQEKQRQQKVMVVVLPIVIIGALVWLVLCMVSKVFLFGGLFAISVVVGFMSALIKEHRKNHK